MSQDTKTVGTDVTAGTGAASSTKSRSVPVVQGKDRDVGSALRSVYQQTVEEAVPGDLLDLLGKLG